MLIKSTKNNNLRFVPKEFTHIFKNFNFRLQGLQIEVFQQRYSKCKWEIPYLEGELIPKTCKYWKMFSKKIFLSGLVTKLENLLVFGKTLWKISSNWWFQKKGVTDLTSAQTSKVCYMDWNSTECTPTSVKFFHTVCRDPAKQANSKLNKITLYLTYLHKRRSP